ncbi:MAG: hypothetical protein PUK42_05155, partial [Prevotellaceae bacterium]|nr:hypothetical protein [Prevotellaceae bacterium]
VEDKNAKKLNSIALDESERIKSTYSEFDRAVGGGLVRDSVTILTARPSSPTLIGHRRAPMPRRLTMLPARSSLNAMTAAHRLTTIR